MRRNPSADRSSHCRCKVVRHQGQQRSSWRSPTNRFKSYGSIAQRPTFVLDPRRNFVGCFLPEPLRFLLRSVRLHQDSGRLGVDLDIRPPCTTRI